MDDLNFYKYLINEKKILTQAEIHQYRQDFEQETIAQKNPNNEKKDSSAENIEEQTRLAEDGGFAGDDEQTRLAGDGGFAGDDEQTRLAGDGGFAEVEEQTRLAGDGGFAEVEEQTRLAEDGGFAEDDDQTRFAEDEEKTRSVLDKEQIEGANSFPDSRKVLMTSSNETESFSNLSRRYQILKDLGEGGMGIVQLVRDNLLGREVALKTIRQTLPVLGHLDERQKMLFWRLNREASITAFLEHPNIVPLYDLEKKEAGELYFTMRKVEGDTLKSIVQQKKKGQKNELDEKLLSIFFKVCDAVAYAHSKGVVHRDLKPENIMVGQFGEVYVMDWGISKVFEPERCPLLKGINEEILNVSEEKESFVKSDYDEDDFKTIGGLGTPGYMSPEQKINAAEASFSTDIHALGKILRELFLLLSPMEEFKTILALYKTKNAASAETKKGRFLFTKQKEASVEEQFEQKLPPDIRAIANKATQQKPEDRYETVQEFKIELERYLKNLRVSAREDYRFSELFSKWCQRNKRSIIASILVLGFLFLFYSYLFWIKQQEFWAALATANKEMEAAEKVEDKLIGEKINHFLKSLNALNHALSLKPIHSESEFQKLKVAKKLILLSCKTEDFQLAEYIAAELASLRILSSSEKKLYQDKVQEEKNKILNYHYKRLDHWIKHLKETRLVAGMKENAIFEISKMKEKEIFQRLVLLLNESFTYFQSEDSHRSQRMDEFYFTMITAFGRLEKPKGEKPLLEILAQIETSKITNNKRDQISTIEYLSTLAHALAYTRSKNSFPELRKLRWKEGPDSLFWEKTRMIYKELLMKKDLTEFKPIKAEEYYQRGMDYKIKEEYELAEKDFTQTIGMNPEHAFAYNERGKVKYEYHQTFEAAIEDFNQAIFLNKNLSSAYNNRGAAKYKLGHFKEALEDYKQAIFLNPLLSSAYNNRGNAYLALKLFEKAIKDYNKALELNPQEDRAYNNRGIAWLQQGDFYQALKDFNGAIKLNPEDYFAYINRGIAKRELSLFQEALSDFEQAIELKANLPDAYFNRGLNYYQKKNPKRDLKQALADLNFTIQLEKEHFEAYYYRGILYKELKKYAAAFNDFNFLLQLNPNFPQVYFHQGELYSQIGNMKEAISAFEKGFLLEKDPKWLKTFLTLLVRNGRSQTTAKKLEEAKSYYLIFQKWAPKNHPFRKKIKLELQKIEETLESEENEIK